MIVSRRTFLSVGGALALSGCTSSSMVQSSRCGLGQGSTPGSSEDSEAFRSTFQSVESRLEGRLGVYGIDASSSRACGYRADERFAMASTFKWILGAAILEEVDAGRCALDERISYTRKDLLQWAPVTEKCVQQGSLSIEELGRAAVASSDNTAANLLLDHLGGPAQFTHFVRAHGDSVTRLDRREPELNENAPGDLRDTTTPRAMAGLLQHVLSDGGLREESRGLLESWMQGATTGSGRLRAGLPQHWKVGNKSGSGGRNAINDVAMARPPGRGALVIACYTTGGFASMTDHEAAHAEVARAIVQRWDLV